jgi:hypothetical protein
MSRKVSTLYRTMKWLVRCEVASWLAIWVATRIPFVPYRDICDERIFFVQNKELKYNK